MNRSFGNRQLIQGRGHYFRNPLFISVFRQIQNIVIRCLNRLYEILDRNRVFTVLFQEHIHGYIVVIRGIRVDRIRRIIHRIINRIRLR
jgi:hypothetical protein